MNKHLKSIACASALALLLVGALIKPAAAEEGASVQGAVCGKGAHSEFSKLVDRTWSLDRGGTCWVGQNLETGDKCGIVFIAGSGEHILNMGGHGVRIRFLKLSDSDRAHVFVTFIIRPHPNSVKVFVVRKPLTDFSFSNQNGCIVASIGADKLAADDANFDVQRGNLDVQKVIIMLKDKAQATLRHVDADVQKYWWTPEIKLGNGDCKLLENERLD